MRRLAVVIGTLAVVGACGGGGDGGDDYVEPAGPPVASFTFEAGSLYFRPEEATVAPPGIIDITMDNQDGTHTLVIEGIAGYKLSASGAESVSGKVELSADTYTVYCDVPGHRAGGMEATLTVEEGSTLPGESSSSTTSTTRG